jgi:hypothetical protein
MPFRVQHQVNPLRDSPRYGRAAKQFSAGATQKRPALVSAGRFSEL